MPIKTRSPFVLDYTPAQLLAIKESFSEFILAECPDYVREDPYAQPAIDFFQDLSDALDDFKRFYRLDDNDINPDDYFPLPSKPKTEEEKRLEIWNSATPQQKKRLEARGLRPKEVTE